MGDKKPPKNVNKLVAKAEAGKAAKKAKQPTVGDRLKRRGAPAKPPKRAPTNVLTLIAKYMARKKDE